MTMDDKTSKLAESLRTLITVLDDAYEALYEQALSVQSEFWDNYWAGNSRVEFKNRSVLGVRARRRENGSFHILWFYNKWGKTREGASVPLSQHIRQSKHGGYTEYSLLKRAQDWEADVVLSVEARLAPIREAAKENRAIKRKIEHSLVKLFPDGVGENSAEN